MHNVMKLCLVEVTLYHADKQIDGLKEIDGGTDKTRLIVSYLNVIANTDNKNLIKIWVQSGTQQ
jgi:hypothetical protein